MNSDGYSESFVQAKRPSWVIPAIIGIALSGIAAVYFLLCMNFLLFFLFVIIATVLSVLLFKFSSVEYEYLYLLDELTIAKIFRKSSRKDVLAIPMQDVETVCPTEDSDAERMRGSGSEVKYLDFSSGGKDVKTYTIKYVSGGRTSFVCIEPNEKMLKQMRHDHPGKVKLRK